MTRDRARGYAACVKDTHEALRVTGDGSRTLFDEAAGQTLHSEHGAVAEARHVYLEGSGVAMQLAQGEVVTVFEVGLGAGLNLLLTLDLAVRHGATLHYRAVERAWLDPSEVAALGWGAHLHDPSLVAWFLAFLEEMRSVTVGWEPSREPVAWTRELPGGGTLTVAYGDAVDEAGLPRGAVRDLLAPASVDAVYHDAFSPAANPRLWEAGFLRACAGALRPGGAWSSYSVAGFVRRALDDAGLEVEKRPGPPGGKREVLVARRPAGR